MTLQLVTAPAVEPLTADEARARLNIGDEVSDAVINALIKTGRQMFDGNGSWLGRAIINQTWDLYLDGFSGFGGVLEKGFGDSQRYLCERYGVQGITIPLPPLQSVTSIKYLDSNNVQQTLDPATYTVLSGEPSHIVLAYGQSWPATYPVSRAVVIRFIAGYGDAGENVDERIRSAIALQVSYLRSLTQQDLFISSETTEGIDSVTRVVSGNAAGVITAASEALLQNLRIFI